MSVKTSSHEAVATDWSLSLQVFVYLQLLDAMTTCVGLRMGLAEASPFVHFLMRMGPLLGLFGSKIVAAVLGAYCVWRRRFHVIALINYWYAALVIWNLTLILSR